ncbi:MAG: hypothetical protein J6Q26_08470 [Bacteroidales bacterium]|nr:hypothetical protein [Bacteroidales bacterium]
MTKNDLIRIIEYLRQDVPYFADFELNKSKCSLIRKYDWGWQEVGFDDYFHGLDRNRKQLALEVRPYYGVRINALHEWMYPLLKPLLVDHDAKLILMKRPSIFFSEGSLRDINGYSYKFLETYEDLEKDYEKLKAGVAEHACYVFEKYSDIKNIYEYYSKELRTYKSLFIGPSSTSYLLFFKLLAAVKVLYPNQFAEYKDDWFGVWDFYHNMYSRHRYVTADLLYLNREKIADYLSSYKNKKSSVSLSFELDASDKNVYSYHESLLDFNLAEYRKGKVIMILGERSYEIQLSSNKTLEANIRQDILDQIKQMCNVCIMKMIGVRDFKEKEWPIKVSGIEELFSKYPKEEIIDNFKYYMDQITEYLQEYDFHAIYEDPERLKRIISTHPIKDICIDISLEHFILSGVEGEKVKAFNKQVSFVTDYLSSYYKKLFPEQDLMKVQVHPNLYRKDIEYFSLGRRLSVFLKMSREEIERFWHLESLPQRCEYCLDLLERAYRQAMSQGWDLPLETLLSIHQQFRENDYRNEQVLLEKCVKKHHLYIEITKVFTPEGIAVNLAAYDDKKKSLKASGQLLHFDTERQFVIDLAKFRVAADNLLIVDQWNTPVYSLSLPDLSMGVITLDKAK